MEESGIHIRFASIEDAAACNDFHNRLYQEHRNLEQWRWEFVANTYKEEPLPFSLVEDQGRIVGTQAFIPIRMMDRRGTFWTAKSEETLVDPDYRGQKLFEKMYETLFAYAREHKLSYVWGFTPAEKAFRRIGFEIPASTSQLIFPFECRRMEVLLARTGLNEAQGLSVKLKTVGYKVACAAARGVSALQFAAGHFKRRRSASVKSLEIRTLYTAPEESGELCRRFVEQWGGTTICRDTEYLRWRVFENPYYKAIMRAAYDQDQLLGWVIYSLDVDGVGYLVDLMFALPEDKRYSSEDVASLLLAEAVNGVRRMGAIAMRGWHVNDHPFDLLVTRTARKMGFWSYRKGQSVVVYDTLAEKEQPAAHRFSDWYVTRIFMEGTVG